MAKHFIAIFAVSVSFILGNVSLSVAQQKPPVLRSGQAVSFPTGTQAPQVQPPPPGQPLPPVPGQGIYPPPPIENAVNAIRTARQARKYLTPGKVWVQRGPAGEITLKAALLYQGVAIGALEFNPVNGAVLPCGYHPQAFSETISMNAVQQNLPDIIVNLSVLDGAEFREPENSWIIPLAYNGAIVSHIKIYADGVYVVPDYPVTQEMQAFGQ